jgi:hypothetical protein
MYSPTLGRWNQPDPIGFSGGDQNLFRTEDNNPVNKLDPSGLQPVPGGYTGNGSPQQGGGVNGLAGVTHFMPNHPPGTLPNLPSAPFPTPKKPVPEVPTTKLTCPTDTCGFTFSISKFSVQSIKIDNASSRTAPFKYRLLLAAISNDDIKKG